MKWILTCNERYYNDCNNAVADYVFALFRQRVPLLRRNKSCCRRSFQPRLSFFFLFLVFRILHFFFWLRRRLRGLRRFYLINLVQSFYWTFQIKYIVCMMIHKHGGLCHTFLSYVELSLICRCFHRKLDLSIFLPCILFFCFLAWNRTMSKLQLLLFQRLVLFRKHHISNWLKFII